MNTQNESSSAPDSASEPVPDRILSEHTRCPWQPGKEELDKHRYECVDPQTGELATRSFPGRCGKNRCPCCGPEKRKTETAHYFRETRKKKGWRFYTVTSAVPMKGTPKQKRSRFKEDLTSFQDSVRYYSNKKLDSNRKLGEKLDGEPDSDGEPDKEADKKRGFEYLRVVEGGCYKQVHAHFLYRALLSPSEVNEIWKEHGSGIVTYENPIRDDAHLLSVIWYMQSQRFYDPENPDQFVPESDRTISSSTGIESYNSESAKARRRDHARRRAAHHLFNGRRPESRILCDEKALQFGQETYLPQMIGEPVRTLQGDLTGTLKAWSLGEAVVWDGEKRREVSPYDLIPQDRKPPLLIEGRASQSLPPGKKSRSKAERPDKGTLPPRQEESCESAYVEKKENGTFEVTLHDQSTGEETTKVYKENPLSDKVPDLPPSSPPSGPQALSLESSSLEDHSSKGSSKGFFSDYAPHLRHNRTTAKKEEARSGSPRRQLLERQLSKRPSGAGFR